MERFFNGSSTSEFFSSIFRSLKENIDQMSDIDIMNKDINGWLDYYYSLYEVQPLTVYEEYVQPEISIAKIKQPNIFYDGEPGEPEFYLIDGYRISYKVFFDGYSELFFMKSNLIFMGKMFDYDEFKAPQNDQLGYFIIHVDFTNSILEKNKTNPDFAKKKFEEVFSNYKSMIKYINSDVNGFNVQLKDQTSKWLNARKDQASSLKLLSEQLQIPMTPNKNAPNILPIPIKRIVRSVPKKPELKEPIKEYSIHDDDFLNINNIVYSCGTAMEKTARSHMQNGEEELRDFLLATLNTHYEGASGETFRKNGKTDIHILFENKAAYIAECKIWHGEKLFDEALQQLISYSTWRDTKVSIIIFNKENKDFQSIISKINEWVKTNTKAHKHNNANSWNCKYYRNDSATEIDLHIVVFDMYVEERKK